MVHIADLLLNIGGVVKILELTLFVDNLENDKNFLFDLLQTKNRIFHYENNGNPSINIDMTTALFPLSYFVPNALESGILFDFRTYIYNRRTLIIPFTAGELV